MNYYVYYLIDPRTSQPFYVGKGQGDRVYQHKKDALNLRKVVNPIKHNKILNILNDDLDITTKIVEYFNCEDDAYERERELIHQHGRLFNNTGCLTNISSGGSTYVKEPIPVKQFTFFGKYIKTFPSRKVAAKHIGTNYPSNISNAINGRMPSYKGFLWCYDGCEPIVPSTILYCWDREGNYVDQYKNEGDASRAVGCKQPQLNDHLKRGGTCKGFVFSKENKFPGIPDNKFKVWESNARNKPVIHLNTGIPYKSVTAAAKATKHNIGTISKICNGHKDNVSGDKFCYS